MLFEFYEEKKVLNSFFTALLLNIFVKNFKIHFI